MGIPKLTNLLPKSLLEMLKEEEFSETPEPPKATSSSDSSSSDHDEEHSRAEDEYHRNPGLYGPDE